MINTAVIMAGGTGERFWPLGKQDKPKQLLRLTSSGKSLMQESIERALDIFTPESIYVVTSKTLINQIQDDLEQYKGINIIAEPEKRNTAPCLAFAAAYISNDINESPDNITMSVLTADHIIEPQQAFKSDMLICIKHASKGGHLVTIGIVPTHPATGFGYIKTGEKIENTILKVSKFVEKPDLQTAQSYLDAGGYYWNSGMFCWRLDLLMSQLSENYDGAETAIESMSIGLKTSNPQLVKEAFCSLLPTSIDYALMERSNKVVVTPSTFSWKDAGALDIIAELNTPDENGNVHHGNVNTISVDSKNNIISSSTGRKIALVGVENMIVIETDGELLISPKSKAQDVKKIVKLL